jgi:hypothetical protein
VATQQQQWPWPHREVITGQWPHWRPSQELLQLKLYLATQRPKVVSVYVGGQKLCLSTLEARGCDWLLSVAWSCTWLLRRLGDVPYLAAGEARSTWLSGRLKVVPALSR